MYSISSHWNIGMMVSPADTELEAARYLCDGSGADGTPLFHTKHVSPIISPLWCDVTQLPSSKSIGQCYCWLSALRVQIQWKKRCVLVFQTNSTISWALRISYAGASKLICLWADIVVAPCSPLAVFPSWIHSISWKKYWTWRVILHSCISLFHLSNAYASVSVTKPTCPNFT